ncbi:MAG: radical SAM protein [Tissierellia bacterium]|nr:radical SAM protein [Tissierellia bacterium]
MSKSHYIIPIFVPHLGCPHDCIFCNQKKITGLSTDIDETDVRNIIEEHLKTFPNRSINIEVAFYGGSFTGIDKDTQRKLLSIPYEYKKMGKINGIRLSTRPDYIDVEILELLRKYSVDTIELGVQSLDEEVLKNSYRGHSVQDVYNAADLIKDFGFNLGLQMMIGLVGDNREKSLFTAKEFVKLNPYCVRIYPTLVIKDTYLDKMYKDGEYKALSIDETVDIVTDILLLFKYYNIDVIRIGLQPTENIQLGKDVVTGPFHPSFRQLVESNIYKLILENYLENCEVDLIKNNILIIETHEKNISNIAGQKSFNIDYLSRKFKLKGIKISKSDLSMDIIEITLGNSKEKIYIREEMEKLLIQRDYDFKRC